MDIVDSPRTSFDGVEEILRDDQPQRPRRADTLPVRFDTSSTGQHRRPLYSQFRAAPIPPSRSSTDYCAPPRPVPANRYQAYYEDEEDNPYNIRNGPTTRHYTAREPSRNFFSDEPVIISRRMDAGNPYIQGGREDQYRQPRRPQSLAPVLRERIIIRERAESRSRSRSRRHRRSPSSPYPSRRARFRSRSRSSSSSSSSQSRSPTRHHHSRSTHLSRRGQYYESSEDDEDDLDTQAFPFTLSRHTKSLVGSDNGFGPLSEVSEKSKGLDSHAAINASALDPGITRFITSSHYTGDGMVDGHHSVKITEIDDSHHARKACAIFKWM